MPRALAQETRDMAEGARRKLETFETQIELTPERFHKPEILKELQKLQRRFKRLQKDLAKLPKRAYP